MRYYTKEWYDLMQKTNYTFGMKKIPDQDYSEAEIKAFYDKALKKMIAEEKKCYNEPPFFLFDASDIDPESTDLEDWIFVDEETGSFIRPKSFEEVKSHLEKEQREAQTEYENRPPFDPSETIRLFEESYRTRMKYGGSRFPGWVLEKVDRRLLALNLLPESVYSLLKMEERANQKALRAINKRAEREWSKQRKQIPREVYVALPQHDSCILFLRRHGKDVVMVIREDGFCKEGASPYRKIVFKDVISFEREKGLYIRTYEDQGRRTSNCTYVHDEVYLLTDGSYEIHFLVSTRDVRYVTVRYRGIRCERGVTIEK